MVQCYGLGTEERGMSPFLHQLLTSKQRHHQGWIPLAMYTRNSGKYDWGLPLLVPRSQVWILADENEPRIEKVYGFHCGFFLM